MTHHLVGVAEVARLFGVSRQRVNEIVASSDDFPVPEADLAAGRIWSKRAVEAWMRRHGRRKGRNMTELSADTTRLIEYFAQKHELQIGQRTAGVLLDLLGSVEAVGAGTKAEIKGRHIGSRDAVKLVTSAAEVRRALNDERT